MRQWRVGSVSMGIVLIFLGVILMLSQFNEWDLVTVSMIWLPTVLIVLGIEIVIYLILSKQEQPVVKYDIFSILFIGFLGFVSVAAYLVSASGVMAAFENVVNTEETHGSLPVIEQPLDGNAEKVVIQPANRQVKLEANNSDKISVFGTFQSNHLTEQMIEKDQVANIYQIGDTVYVQLFEAPKQQGIGYDSSQFSTTVSIPGNIAVDVREPIYQVNLDLEKISANWYVEYTDHAVLSDNQAANLTLVATTNQLVEELKERENEDKSQDETEAAKVEKEFGEGTYKLTFGTAYHLQIK